MMFDGLMSRCTTPHAPRRQSARGLLNHFKRQRERQGTFAPHFGFERSPSTNSMT